MTMTMVIMMAIVMVIMMAIVMVMMMSITAISRILSDVCFNPKFALLFHVKLAPFFGTKIDIYEDDVTCDENSVVN